MLLQVLLPRFRMGFGESVFKDLPRPERLGLVMKY
jgi:hypothetical protein